MNFRRLPFQFSTTDPAERQRELEKRFGFPTISNNMYIDGHNPLLSGTTQKQTSSPRLQHRVPIFADGYDQPIHSSVDSMGSENKKPNVRIIPIEIEGAETRPASRHRTFSGPVGVPKENSAGVFRMGETSPVKRSMEDLSRPSKIQPTTGPRIHNIPVHIEDANNFAKNRKNEKVIKIKKDSLSVNGDSALKSLNKVESSEQKVEPNTVEDKEIKLKSGIENSLKKIEDVLVEFKNHETGVQEFNGTSKDKQYRYLDEMLTRCMLKLDDIDTMGNEEVRLARKNAVKKVQSSIDLLESKSNATNEVSVNIASENGVSSNIQNNIKSSEGSAETTDVDMNESNGIQHDAKDNTTILTANEEFAEIQLTNIVEKHNSENKLQNQDSGKIQVNDAEMEKNEDKGVEGATEGSSIQQTVSDISSSNTEMPGESEEDQSSDITEVEMAEVPNVTISKDSESKVSEVEMTDLPQLLSNTVLITENDASNVQTSLDTIQDIEMKDVQIDNISESTVSDNENISKNVSCTSSQSEEQDLPVNMETKVDAAEESLSNELPNCSSTVNNAN